MDLRIANLQHQVCLSVCLSVSLAVSLSVSLAVSLSVVLSLSLAASPAVPLSICLRYAAFVTGGHSWQRGTVSWRRRARWPT
eukprot:521320-Rhodomonas_salina.1